MSTEMKVYVDDVCMACAAKGATVVTGAGRDGAVVTPLSFEVDEFSGVWFVEFGLATEGRFSVYRLDLGQARFRFSGAVDVAHPDAIRRDQAEAKRGDLIEALDRRFGPDHVNTAAQTPTEAEQIWKRLWPCK